MVILCEGGVGGNWYESFLSFWLLRGGALTLVWEFPDDGVGSDGI